MTIVYSVWKLSVVYCKTSALMNFHTSYIHFPFS